MAQQIDLAVLGGSGFYEMPGLEALEEVQVSTPFGPPSDSIRIGTLEGRRIAFLARHGRRHTLLPSELPQLANLWALKSLDVSRVLAVSAVGSLRLDYEPSHLVLPDQLIDRTSGKRPATFFGNGVVAHVAFADPFCPGLRVAIQTAAETAGVTAHAGGTYVVVEGPAFGTRAESELFRSWGASVVGMTALPEARLAREAELCYAVLAAVTDYDAWHDIHGPVDASTVFAALRANVSSGQMVVRELLRRLPSGGCKCGSALDSALVTDRASIPAPSMERLSPILARTLS
jgi:5'-methylthioadenosine phosphorylase